jgi:DNA-binding CsgD family transcriptional regulator
MSVGDLNTFIALPVINNDLELKGLFQEADDRTDAILFIANVESNSIIYLNHKFETRTGYGVLDAMRGGPEFLFSITDETAMPEIVARQAMYASHARQENFDPREAPLQEFPVVFKCAEGSKLSLHTVGTTLTYTPTYNPQFFVSLWTNGDEESISDCTNLLVRIKIRHNEIYTHPVFNASPATLTPIYLTNSSRENLLSKREQEVIQLLSDGFSTKEIAEQLGVSFNTIETHRKHLLSKLKAKNVAELIKKASKVYWLK